MLRSRAVSALRHVEQLARSRVLRNPQSLINDLTQRLDELDQQSLRAIRRRLERQHDQLVAIASRAEALSPLAVLGRGYSMTMREQDGELVRSAADVRVGERIITRVAKGQIESEVVSDSAHILF
jgi:exodeoxyribonuclease VII large subunit